MLEDKSKPLTDVDSQMSQTVGDLQKLPHVLAVQNPLQSSSGQSSQSSSQQNVGPITSDAKTAYITVRFDVQPSTLGDDYLTGVDTSVQPCARPVSTSSTADRWASWPGPRRTTGSAS